jgi:hypothetical protein
MNDRRRWPQHIGRRSLAAAVAASLAMSASALTSSPSAESGANAKAKEEKADKSAASEKSKQSAEAKKAATTDSTLEVDCANLSYGGGKTSRCVAPVFLKEFSTKTEIPTTGKFASVNLSDAAVFDHPFCVMSGEGAFTLTEAERTQVKEYLTRGGFLLASAGCSSEEWSKSFRREIAAIFPDDPLEEIPLTHALFRTVHDIGKLDTKRRNHTAKLEGLTLDGRLAIVFSSDGLNDTASAGGNCCCCGGDEIVNARQVNVNILAYALTH